MAGFCKRINTVQEAATAKVLAALHAVLFALDRNVMDVITEGDVSNVINLIKSKDSRLVMF